MLFADGDVSQNDSLCESTGSQEHHTPRVKRKYKKRLSEGQILEKACDSLTKPRLRVTYTAVLLLFYNFVSYYYKQ
jgi:hypothetical protein